MNGSKTAYSGEKEEEISSVEGIRVMAACFVRLLKEANDDLWYQPAVSVRRHDPAKPIAEGAFLFTLEVEQFAVERSFAVIARIMDPDGATVCAQTFKNLPFRTVEGQIWGSISGLVMLDACPPLGAGTHVAELYIDGKLIAEARLVVR